MNDLFKDNRIRTALALVLIAFSLQMLSWTIHNAVYSAWDIKRAWHWSPRTDKDSFR